MNSFHRRKVLWRLIKAHANYRPINFRTNKVLPVRLLFLSNNCSNQSINSLSNSKFVYFLNHFKSIKQSSHQSIWVSSFNQSSSSNRENDFTSFSNENLFFKNSFKLILCATIALIIYRLDQEKFSPFKRINAKELSQDELAKQYGKSNKNLPTITIDELNKHNCKENRIWIAYREGKLLELFMKRSKFLILKFIFSFQVSMISPISSINILAVKLF